MADQSTQPSGEQPPKRPKVKLQDLYDRGWKISYNKTLGIWQASKRIDHSHSAEEQSASDPCMNQLIKTIKRMENIDDERPNE